MRRKCTKKPVILVTKPLAGYGGVTGLPEAEVATAAGQRPACVICGTERELMLPFRNLDLT